MTKLSALGHALGWVHGFASRLGVKIVAAMLLIAIIPLVVSTILVDQVIRVSDSVAEGQTRRLVQPLAHTAEAYRQIFAERKRLFAQQGALIAVDPVFLAAVDEQRRTGKARLLTDYFGRVPDLSRAHLRDASGGLIWAFDAPRPAGRGQPKELTLQLPLSDRRMRLQLTFHAEGALFDSFRELGRAQRTALEITDLRAELASHYRVVFLLMFGAALLAATALGLVIARRMVRRVGLLVSATRNVAAGDLETYVHLKVRDELGELAGAFNDMVRELRENRERIAYLEKIGAWQEVARRLAHEIKNPLTPIQLALQQLHRKYAGDDPVFSHLLDEACEIVSEEVDGLRRLVRDFSSFAKLPSVQPEAVELNAVIDDFLRSHTDLAERARIAWEPLRESCVIAVDRMLIKNCLYNLVQNAVQAAAGIPAEGTLAVTISAQLRPSGRHVAIAVADNGPGMDAETKAHVFDPYYTQTKGGTGLGLAIVKKTILEHQGAIFVDSSPGKGASFTIVLPVESRDG